MVTDLVVKVKALSKEYSYLAKKNGSKKEPFSKEEFAKRLEALLTTQEELIQKRIDIETYLRQTDLVDHYKRIKDYLTYRKQNAKTPAELMLYSQRLVELDYARKEELMKADICVKSLEDEKELIGNVIDAFEDNEEHFNALYNDYNGALNNGRPKDDSETPHPMDEIESKIDPFKVVQLTL